MYKTFTLTQSVQDLLKDLIKHPFEQRALQFNSKTESI